MKAFSEKSDLILRTLLTSSQLNWDEFTQLTQIKKDDALLTFLKNTDMIMYSETGIKLSAKGREFISTTSFTEQRDKNNPPR